MAKATHTHGFGMALGSNNRGMGSGLWLASVDGVHALCTFRLVGRSLGNYGGMLSLDFELGEVIYPQYLFL